MKTRSYFVASILAILSTFTVHAQGTTAFVYQGQLRDGGTNANGNYAMTFKLYDAVSAGNQVGSTINTTAALANGIFSVNLDFGSAAFDGTARWLDITVNNGTTIETLSPRVQLLPTPYALYSANAAQAGQLTSGTWSLHTGDFGTISNVFEIFDNGIFVMGMSTNGVKFNDGIDVGKLNVDGNASFNDNININNSSSIFLSNSNQTGGVSLSLEGDNSLAVGGSLLIQNNLQFVDGTSLSIGGQGSLMTSGNLTTSNVMFYGNTLLFPSQSGASIIVQTNGDFMFNNGVRLSSLGIIKVPTPDQGAISLTGYNFGGGGGHLLGMDATVQANGLNIPNGSGGYVLVDASSSGFVVHSHLVVPNGDIHINNGGIIASGNISANSFTTTSDRNVKENFTPVDPREVLDRVAALPISRWNFKTDGNTRHIGPMAQDFYQKFQVGADDRHIATVDEEGVALAAIQGLNEKLKEKDAEIQSLEKRLAELEKMVKPQAKTTDAAK